MDEPGMDAQDAHDLLKRAGHILREPLSAILHLTDLLLWGTEGELSAAAQADMRDIRGAAERVLKVIDKTLELIRIENVPPQPSALNISVVLRKCIEDIASLINCSHRRIVTDVPADTPPVWADYESIRFIIHALLIHWLDFAEGETLIMTCHTENGTVVVSFQNGDTRQSAERISIKALLNSHKNDALSLDLLIIRRLIDLQHGRLEIFQQPDTGTGHIEFRVTLPICEKALTE